MGYKILESNGVEIENIDGGAFNNFCADGKSGIISEVLDECKIVAQGNVITVGSGELLIKGVRVKIEESMDFTLSGSPAVETHYYIVSKIVLSSDGSIIFDMFLTTEQTRKQDNLYKNNNGTYELELAKFTHSVDGSIKNVNRTATVLGKSQVEDITKLFNDLEENLREELESFKEDTINQTQNSIQKNSSRITENSNRIETLETALIKDGIIEKKDGVITKTSQKTGGENLEGLTILDGSYVSVQKISGATVKSKNLFDISKITTHYWKHPSNNQYAYITNNGDGTLTMESVGYTIPMGVTLREVCPSLKVGDKVVAQAIAEGALQNFITFAGVWLYNHMSTEITEEMLNSEIKIKSLWNGGDAYTVTYSNMQIEIAEKSTEYVPYFAGLKNACFEKIISTGRNLINVPDQSITISSSDSTSYKNVDLGFRLKSNTTYTISYDYNVQSINGTLTPIVDRFIRDDNNKVVTANGLWTDTVNTLSNGKALCTFTTKTITQGKDRLFVRFVRLESAGDLQATATNIMLNLGDTAFAYEPYTESVVKLDTPRELGEWDYINPQTGQLIKATKTIVFDGTENWYENTAKGEIYFSTTLPELGSLETTRCICSHFESAGEGICGSGVYQSGTAFVVAVQTANQFASLEEFKSYLNSTPITVAYKLRTPEITNIVIDKFYIAYNNGAEIVVQGATDNSQYKALCNINNEYIIFLGGNKE